MSRLFRSGLRSLLVHGGPLPKWLIEHPRRQYIEAQALAGVPWADRSAIHRKERERDRLTRATGVQHVLDHIYPLTHPLVFGLTVADNLRVVPYNVNAGKSNGIGFNGDLFEEPEQLRLV